MMEISEEQFERLIDLITDVRVEMANAQRDLGQDISEASEASRKRSGLLAETVKTIEEDLSSVQGSLRALARTLSQHTQALEGLTELAKSNYDMNVSILKLLHGDESSQTSHVGAPESSRASDPQ